ncbi:MAG: hypothetical protein ING71_17425 [Rhodocyclaceae bacterium]|nr:hypothetical protein [Rhodocyclaceae bacterium]
MSRADQLTAEYLMRKVEAEPFTGPMPRCVVEPIAERPADYVSPLRFAAGAVVLGFVFVLIFWGIA